MADLDRLLREQNPEPGQPRVPVPQYQKVGAAGFERVTGQNGGAHAVLLGPNGQPISSGNRLPVDTGLSGNLQIIADNQGRLYGRTESGSWLPVRVNSSGQLELAQNVVIDNVTVNVGSEVKVNNDESEPVPVQLSGNIVELARGGATTITAGNVVQIYATTSNDFTHMAVGARGGSSVPIANFSFRLSEYTDDSLSPSKGFRASTFKNEASTNYLIYGVVDVYGKRVSIGVINSHDADITINSWVIYGIRGR